MNPLPAILVSLVLSHLPEIDGAVRPQNRIIYGYDTDIYHAPFVVQLHLSYIVSNPLIGIEGFCGGSLVTQRHIVTAAHCLDGNIFPFLTLLEFLNGFLSVTELFDIYGPGDPLEIIVVAGSSTLVANPDDPDSTTCRRTVSFLDYDIHENYNPTTLAYDIGLIILPEPFTSSDCPNANCISLPGINVDFIPGLYVIICGHGRTEDGELSTNLKCGEMMIEEKSICDEVYGEISDTSLCVTAIPSGNTYFCNGDSGSAMFIVENGSPMEVCIVSFGHVDSCENYPQGCTKISPFIEWICKDDEDCPANHLECLP